MPFPWCRVAAVWILACSASGALAQPIMTPPPSQEPRTPYQEALRLQRRGDPGAALALLEKRIAETPRDVQARFLRGVILSDQKRTADAIEAFSALTREFPELPEPFNNLAVLYAADGRYEDARRMLEQSLVANPLNPVARQNLGDVHIQLARIAYEQALKAEPKNRALRAKLALIAELGKSAPSPAGDIAPSGTPAAGSPLPSTGDRK